MFKKFKVFMAIAMVLILCLSGLTAFAAETGEGGSTEPGSSETGGGATGGVTGGVTAGTTSETGGGNPIVTDDENKPVQAAINKTLQLPRETIIPNVTFEFIATKVSLDGSTADDAIAKMPTLNEQNLKILFSEADRDKATLGSNDVVSVIKESVDIFAGAKFPHAGVYVYTLREKENTNQAIDGNAPHEVLTYSKALYTLTVYVANNAAGDGTYIIGLGTRVTQNTDGQPGDGNKIDPTPGGNGEDYFFSQMVFVNTYVKTNGATDPNDPDPKDESESTLNVRKEVAGDFASREQYFNFTMSLTIPPLVSPIPPFYRAYVVENGAVGTSTANAAQELLGQDAGGQFIRISTSGETKFNLKDSQTLVFVNTPVGTGYNVTEAATPSYTPNVLVTTNGTPGERKTGEMNTALSTGGQFVGETINRALFTNTRDSITPTGLNLNDLPFIGLIALAIASLVIFVIVKSRKRSITD